MAALAVGIGRPYGFGGQFLVMGIVLLVMAAIFRFWDLGYRQVASGEEAQTRAGWAERGRWAYKMVGRAGAAILGLGALLLGIDALS